VCRQVGHGPVVSAVADAIAERVRERGPQVVGCYGSGGAVVKRTLLRWLPLLVALLAYDVYLLVARLAEVQGNVEAQFIIVTPGLIASHLLARHRQDRQHDERMDAHAELVGRQEAHSAELAAHRQEMAAVAEKVGELHDFHPPSEVSMALADLSALDGYKTGGFPRGYLPGYRAFYSPVDQVHGVLRDVVSSARHSLVISMFGFDDDELADIIKAKLADPSIVVQLTFDSSQAGGVHEKAILAREQYPASSVAVGRSERGGIVHLKLIVVDGEIVITGSTNLSASGEGLQDNVCEVIHDPYVAAEARSRVDAIHQHIVQAAAKKAVA
jgi:phosphatidylserine/phosphatidylglycerophosphate/cardiolipin synthase-like enzyme